MLPDPAKCTKRVSAAACKLSADATATTASAADRAQHCSTHTTSTTTGTSPADGSRQRSTDSTAHRSLMTERRLFIPSVLSSTENDRRDCNLKLKAIGLNGYKSYQLTAAETVTDIRADRQES